MCQVHYPVGAKECESLLDEKVIFCNIDTRVRLLVKNIISRRTKIIFVQLNR